MSRSDYTLEDPALMRIGRAIVYALAAILMAALIYAMIGAAAEAEAQAEPNLSIGTAPAIGQKAGYRLAIGESSTYRARIRNYTTDPLDPAGPAYDVRWALDIPMDYEFTIVSAPPGTVCGPVMASSISFVLIGNQSVVSGPYPTQGIVCTTAVLNPGTSKTVIYSITRVSRGPDGQPPITIAIIDPAGGIILGPIRETATLP